MMNLAIVYYANKIMFLFILNAYLLTLFILLLKTANYIKIKNVKNVKKDFNWFI